MRPAHVNVGLLLGIRLFLGLVRNGEFGFCGFFDCATHKIVHEKSQICGSCGGLRTSRVWKMHVSVVCWSFDSCYGFRFVGGELMWVG